MAFRAWCRFHPHEIFYFCFFATIKAGSLIQTINFLLYTLDKALCFFSKGIDLQFGKGLTYNPMCHWIDITTDNVKSKSIGLKYWGSTSHKGVTNNSPKFLRNPKIVF